MVDRIDTALVSRHIVAMKGNGGEITPKKMTGASKVIPRLAVDVHSGGHWNSGEVVARASDPLEP